MKHLAKFVTLEIEVVDSQSKFRTLLLSSKKSIVSVIGSRVEVPILLGEGWQLVKVDLEDLVFKAFGTAYLKTVHITINSACRLSKLFMADQVYSDAQLPPHLRVLKSSKKMYLIFSTPLLQALTLGSCHWQVQHRYLIFSLGCNHLNS